MGIQFNQYLNTSMGIIKIQASQIALTHIQFASTIGLAEQTNAITQETCNQLNAYLAGKLQHFDLPLAPAGTKFQQQVWHQLLTVPYGTTQTYGDIAHGIKNAKAVRAVGAANGRNPIAIVIPCHRIIGSNGKLTGYAWGTDIKARLLSLEQNNPF